MAYPSISFWRFAMKRFLITVTLCLAFCGGALAQQADPDAPATAADIQTYLNTINSHDMMKQMMAAMSKPMHQMVHDQYVKDKDKLPADFEAQMNKIMDDMLAGMPVDEMMQAMVPVYQKHFTKRDVDDLVAFYSSPVGQKMLKQMPAIMGEAMQSMMPIMNRYTDTMKQRLNEQTADLMKQSEKTPGQNSPAPQN
jgi:uncharacterized protein